MVRGRADAEKPGASRRNNPSDMNIRTLSILCLALGACTKEGPAGPAGRDGNANVDAYEFSLSLSAFHHYSSSHVWAEPAPSWVPNLTPDQLALVYIWLDPIDGGYEWVQQPVMHYFNAGNTTNEFFHGVESDGDLWLYIRNSTGGQPYLTMTGSLQYKVFIIESRMAQAMDDQRVDRSDAEAVLDFAERQGYTVTYR